MQFPKSVCRSVYHWLKITSSTGLLDMVIITENSFKDVRGIVSGKSGKERYPSILLWKTIVIYERIKGVAN